MTSGGFDTPSEILGLPLPAALRYAIATQRWTPPADRQTVEAVFSDDAPQPCFYEALGIESETRNFRDDPYDHQQYFTGTPPDDIDPYRCLLIGDLGPDQPIALDYRHDTDSPRVLYLHRTMDWIEVAADIDALMSRLSARPTDADP